MPEAFSSKSTRRGDLDSQHRICTAECTANLPYILPPKRSWLGGDPLDPP